MSDAWTAVLPAAWTAVLPAAWTALLVIAALRLRPAPDRVRRLAAVPAAGADRGWVTGLRETGGRLAERLGAWLFRRMRRESDPAAARRLGTAVVAAAAVAPLWPPASPVVGLVAWNFPRVRAGRAQRRRVAAMAADLPDVVDLLVLAVGAGLTVGLAVTHVARRGSGPLAAELRRVTDDVALGRRLADSLDDLPARAGEAVRPLVGALVASERYGAPLVTSLERLADEVRRDRRRRAEEAARKIPVKLLFPLVTCTLPAFGLLTVAPLIASAVRSLRI